VVKEFGFVIDWPTLSEEQKNKQFTKFISHELNTFIYFKDPNYF